MNSVTKADRRLLPDRRILEGVSPLFRRLDGGAGLCRFAVPHDPFPADGTFSVEQFRQIDDTSRAQAKGALFAKLRIRLAERALIFLFEHVQSDICLRFSEL